MNNLIRNLQTLLTDIELHQDNLDYNNSHYGYEASTEDKIKYIEERLKELINIMVNDNDSQ